MWRFFSILWVPVLISTSLSAQEARIAEIFEQKDISLYAEAVAIYLEWIQQAGTPQVQTSHALIRHLRWIELITAGESSIHRSARLLVAGQGSPRDAGKIVAWWHRQDPYPATYLNERIEEHLYRIYYAERHYSDRQDSLGVDDRGRIYVRLGHPWRSDKITLQNPQLQILPMQFRLPPNEIWVYRNIHDDAHYLFVQASYRSPYQIATPESLIPSNLLRTRRHTPTLLVWMEDIFGQLAMEHPYYGLIYDAVTNYTTLPTSAPLPPYEFSQNILQDSRARSGQHQLRRTRSVPAHATQVYGNTKRIQPALRFIRFLEADGSTRMDVYWSIDVQDIRPARSMIRRMEQLQQQITEDFVLSTALTRRDASSKPRRIEIRRYHLPKGQKSRVYIWSASDYSLASTIAMQWSLHWTIPDSIPPQPAAVWAVGVEVQDTLGVLQGDGTRLELSDLKPLVLASPDRFDDSVPYVGDKMTTDTPLGLYFEIYFLQFNEEDQTRYRVDYSLRSKDKTSRTTSFTYQGEAATVREFIAIDATPGRGKNTLILKVTDLISGQTVSRFTHLDYVE